MAKEFYQKGIGLNKNDETIVSDDKLAEVERAVYTMANYGLPAEVILERVLEDYRNRDLINEEHMHEAEEAFRTFKEKFQKAQRAVSRDLDPFPSDSMKVAISPANSSKTSRPQSRGARHLFQQSFHGEKTGTEHQRIFVSSTPAKALSRPSSRGTIEKPSNAENSVSCLQQCNTDDRPFFLVRSVSREELRAAVLQPAPLETAAIFHPPQLPHQSSPQFDFEPIKEAAPIEDPIIEQRNKPHQPEIKKDDDDKFLPKQISSTPRATVAEYVYTNGTSPEVYIAEKLIENESTKEKQGEGSLKTNTLLEVNKKMRTEPKIKTGLSTAQIKPPPESSLAGGEGSLSIQTPIQLPTNDVRDPAVQNATRTSHRTIPSASRSNVSRKRTVLPKKKENSTTKRIIMAASFIGFIAVGGYVIYKNRSSSMY